MNTVSNIREYFKEQLRSEKFIVDKSGVKTLEMIGACFIADEPAIFGIPSQNYINAELSWYQSQSTNIHDILGPNEMPPAAWVNTADAHGNVNSNYGHLVYADKYHNQYDQAFAELWSNPDSRRAQMVYTRPSIWAEYNEAGKSDFICTNAQTFYIRDNTLHMVSQMRSNDVVFGYKNDFAWAQHLMDTFVKEWNQVALYADATQAKVKREQITKGTLTWQVMNLHVYARHFHLV